MNLGEARTELQWGKKVARTGWNDKGMYLLLVNSNEYSIHFHADLSKGWGNNIPELAPWIGMKTVYNKFVPWLASQTDFLANDWVVVE